MKIGVPKETAPGERRAALSPEVARKLVAAGHALVVESGLGEAAAIPDRAFADAGASLVDGAAEAFAADAVFKVQAPRVAEGRDELALMKPGTALLGLLAPFAQRERVRAYAEAGIVAVAMEFVPRITRAQGMDALSSQSTVAGYRAVIEAAHAFGRLMPMLMTAAGTVSAARVLVLGAGVAGLQAIATARRLGGVVSAFDVRPAVKEQVQSLGAKFIEIEAVAEEAETKGGYAREMSAEYQARQRALIHETLKKTDIVIATALIPGKPAPVLITGEMVEDMAPGSVIVDLAAEGGGNCALTERDRVLVRHGVTLIGHANMAARAPVHASALYAKNLYNLLALLTDKDSGALAPQWDDDIVKGAVLTRAGAIVNPALERGEL